MGLCGECVGAWAGGGVSRGAGFVVESLLPDVALAGAGVGLEGALGTIEDPDGKIGINEAGAGTAAWGGGGGAFAGALA